jgi:hypothetical protein
MGKGGICSTKHHCPGRNCKVGNISPGGCDRKWLGNLEYSDKHEMPCRNGCEKKKHLKNAPGCKSCIAKMDADKRRERLEAEEERNKGKKDKDDDFWNPGKDRKK